MNGCIFCQLKKDRVIEDTKYLVFAKSLNHYLIDDLEECLSKLRSSSDYRILNGFGHLDIFKKFKLELIHEILASKELYLANYYLDREKWIPAINRFKNVLKDHETSIYTEEAIHRLVELYYHIGLHYVDMAVMIGSCAFLSKRSTYPAPRRLPQRVLQEAL